MEKTRKRTEGREGNEKSFSDFLIDEITTILVFKFD